MSLPVVASAPLVNPEDLEIPDKIVIQDNALKGIVPIENPAIDFGLKNEKVLVCLIEKESQGNEKAKGGCGEIGCLQFLPSTFERFCVKKYKLAKKEDIWNCEIQKKCADRMIEEGYWWLWTTWWKCKKNWH
jgi:hypothetical protein